MAMPCHDKMPFMARTLSMELSRTMCDKKWIGLNEVFMSMYICIIFNLFLILLRHQVMDLSIDFDKAQTFKTNYVHLDFLSRTIIQNLSDMNIIW